MGIYHILDVNACTGPVSEQDYDYIVWTPENYEMHRRTMKPLIKGMEAMMRERRAEPEQEVTSNQTKCPPIGVVLATFICRQKVTDYMYWWIWHQYSCMTIFNVLSEVFVCKNATAVKMRYFPNPKACLRMVTALRYVLCDFRELFHVMANLPPLIRRLILYY